jgi:hypothetical protein
VVGAAVADGWDLAALRKEEVADECVAPAGHWDKIHQLQRLTER